MTDSPTHGVADPSAPARLAVGLVSAGRVGTALGQALESVGHVVGAVVARSAASRERVAKRLPDSEIFNDPAQVAARSELLILAVPDDVLPDVVTELADGGQVRPGTIVMHVAGAHGTAVLAPLTSRGALGLAIHPAMTFVGGAQDTERMRSACFAITADDEDPSLQGGSYVAIQRYVHDMPAWTSLSTESQEAAIGRTKADNIEMDDAVKPSNSHIALNVITDDDGNELDILRDNMPYGYADGERGTFFIAYSRSPEITERMLENMFIGDPPGNTDRLLDFTTAVTGSQYYAPPGDFLDDPPPPPGGSAAAPAEPTLVATTTSAAEPTESSARSDGSLGIGSLH